MDKGVIQDIAQAVLKAFAQDEAYVPCLPDLRIRFSATSEEVLSGIRLSQAWLGAGDTKGAAPALSGLVGIYERGFWR